MSTAASTATVNDAPPAALLLSVSALARLRGRDKALISRQVTKLEEAGKLRSYPGERNIKLINVAEFDLAIGETGDAVKVQAAETARLLRGEDMPPLLAAAAGVVPADGSLAAAQRLKVQYESELKKLELAERRKLIVPVAALTEALRGAGDTAAQLLDRLPLRAAEIAAAAAKDGEAGVRAVLKAAAFELRAGLAAAWRKMESEGLAEEAAGPLTVELSDDTIDATQL